MNQLVAQLINSNFDNGLFFDIKVFVIYHLYQASWF